MGLLLKASPEMAKDYFQMFVNRRAYTLQTLKPHSDTGRHYYRPKHKGTGSGQSDRRHPAAAPRR
jgi:hypothetical protein